MDHAKGFHQFRPWLGYHYHSLSLVHFCVSGMAGVENTLSIFQVRGISMQAYLGIALGYQVLAGWEISDSNKS